VISNQQRFPNPFPLSSLSLINPLVFTLYFMSSQRNTKRKRGPMIIGEVESAEVVTPKTVYETKKDGTVRSKQVWEQLDPTSTHVTPVVDKRKERAAEYEPDDFRNPSPQPEPSHTSPVSVSLNYFFEIFNSFRHNVITWSNMLTGSRSSSRLQCHGRPCRTLPDPADIVTNR
jgi:hypothetical protein